MNIKFRVLRQFYKYNMTQSSVAAALGMSASRMRDYLAAEKTSYSKLLKAVRARMAVRLIAEGKTTDCIMYELGYESDSAFYVGFKQFMGVNYVDYIRHVNRNSLERAIA